MILDELFQIQQHDGKNWILLDDFVEYLWKEESSETPRYKLKYSIKRAFEKYTDNLVLIDGKEAVSVLSVLKFIFHNNDKYQECNRIAKNIEKKLVSDSEQLDTIYDLYRCIAKENYTNDLETSYKPFLDYDEQKIETLYTIHKVHFTSEEWKHICLFEVHFGQTCGGIEKDDPEAATRARWTYYRLCQQARSLGNKLRDISKKCIHRRTMRANFAKASQRVKIKGNKFHCPAVIEDHIYRAIDHLHPDTVSFVVTVDRENSAQNNAIDLYVELTSETDINVIASDVVNIINNQLQRKHCIKCSDIVFLSPGTLEAYTCKEKGRVARFTLRDDLLQGSLQGSVVHCISQRPLSSDVDPVCEDELSDGDECFTCFQAIEIQPLCIQSFDIVREWLYDVPLPVRLIFEPHINKKSLKDSSDRLNLLKRKLDKLYCAYDVLLNIHSFKYTGILQQANTDELVMGYKSAQTVFKVTSTSGATHSLSYAERSLKDRAYHDELYYDAYLKEYPLTYETAAGLVTKGVRMRDCHVLFMMDNLVRLKFTNDPDRGDVRSKQMDTLPVTVQGIPKDALITEAWHDPNICDGSECCPCKNSVHLTTADIERVLWKMTETEQAALEKFKKLSTWGVAAVFHDMDTDAMLYLAEHNFGVSNFEEEAATNSDDSGELQYYDERVIEKEGVNLQFSQSKDDNHDDGGQGEASLIREVLHALHIAEMDFPHDESYDPLLGIDEPGISMITPVSPNRTSHDMSLDDDIGELEESFDACMINEEPDLLTHPLPEQFGFMKAVLPPLLYRHPPPYSGRDDDPAKLKEIVDDQLTMLGFCDGTSHTSNKILFGPDHKIGKNLLNLIRGDKKYDVFLPEFPCLHLRKSRITILFSAYKDAGLMQLLQYMRDDDTSEWAKLVSASHIDDATRNVGRLSKSLHISFLMKFWAWLQQKKKDEFGSDLKSLPAFSLSEKWDDEYQKFLTIGSEANATFALHKDMMLQMDDILAIKLAERLGGHDGYNLLIATSKGSLPFSFVNNATSYSPYCTLLLYEHHRAGPFHRNLKHCLFSTPLKDGQINMASDTKREVDHQCVTKGFRSGSTMGAVMRRMALVDTLSEVHDMRSGQSATKDDFIDHLGWKTSKIDLKHIVPVVKLILQRGGLAMEAEDIPYNVYSKVKCLLSSSLLNHHCSEVAKYLIMKYLASEGLFGCTQEDIPNIDDLTGPKDLLSKAKQSKGVTIRRTGGKVVQPEMSERQIKEAKRQKVMTKEIKRVQGLTSDMNTCQALVKPDCSKHNVMKSRGISLALSNHLTSVVGTPTDNPESLLQSKRLIAMKQKCLPQHVVSTVSFATMEFAGVKFKGKSETITQYFHRAEHGYIQKTIHQLPKLQHLVICEEKYKYTPDAFKAATRAQRVSSKDTGITHLKSAEEVLSGRKLDRAAVTSTLVGKTAISTYVAANAKKLSICKDFILDIDSELTTGGCSCDDQSTSTCQCCTYCIPSRCTFTSSGIHEITKLDKIHQRKGEGEMSQVDWLVSYRSMMKPGEAAASIVTSGDIDAVTIHLFVLAKKWPRDNNGNFLNEVYVILHKPQKMFDIYNITSIIKTLEYGDSLGGVKVALGLCLAGNDFIPKVQFMSHNKVLQQLMTNQHFHTNLFIFQAQHITINPAVYKEFVKVLYCRKRLSTELPYDEVRRMTMTKQGKTSSATSTLEGRLNDPDKWMPPASALDKMVELIDLQISYLQTAGQHDAIMPNFLASSCLKETSTGQVEYDFGADSKATTSEILSFLGICVTPTKSGQKRSSVKTPQSGQRRKMYKRVLHSTPVKQPDIN